jgi:Uma2 family endonuclease
MARLAHQLSSQLDIDRFEVRSNTGRLSYLDETCFIPGVYVVPVELIENAPSGVSESLEVIGAPLPFVAEIWSPSTGNYDTDKKIPEYQRRGDHEIRRIRPFERSITVWTRTQSGGYQKHRFDHGPVRLFSLAEVVVDIDILFAFRS